MAPAYLRAQLARSLARLNLEALELLYLHNAAEMQLPALGHSGFMDRLRAAFTWVSEAGAGWRDGAAAGAAAARVCCVPWHAPGLPQPCRISWQRPA
jgi:aryl-alcohol dehydrogenase-like predicted oxidoreductase